LIQELWLPHIRTKRRYELHHFFRDIRCNQLKTELAKVPDMDGLELASVVSTTEEYELGDPEAPIKVAVWIMV
jgi:carbamoyl-phosphate synthase small subunit